MATIPLHIRTKLPAVVHPLLPGMCVCVCACVCLCMFVYACVILVCMSVYVCEATQQDRGINAFYERVDTFDYSQSIHSMESGWTLNSTTAK